MHELDKTGLEVPERLWLSAPDIDNEHDVWFDASEGGTEYVRADLAYTSAEEQREHILETVVAPDNGSVEEVFAAVLVCAKAWVPEARIMGNVRAGDIARAVQAVLSSTSAGVTEEQTPSVTEALRCLEELANMPLGISLEDWSRLSSPILAALEASRVGAEA